MTTCEYDLNTLQEAINKCVRCGYCRQWDWNEVEAICPVLSFVPGWETNFARGHVWQARQLLQLKNETNSIQNKRNKTRNSKRIK